MASPLNGRTVALAEGRQLEDLARMLETEGASVLRCPMLAIVDTPDETSVLEWLADLEGGRLETIILMTGEGLRRLRGFAQRAGREEHLLASLGRTSIVSRGPKPVQALKQIGLTASLVASPATTDGVIAALRTLGLQGQMVGVQLAGAENPTLVGFLESAGATVRTVLPYLYAPASEAEPVAKLIDRMAAGGVDVIVFTSAPQVDRLYEVARQTVGEERLRQGLARVSVAAVGPVVAENLLRRGDRVDICPSQGFVMKNLVQHIKRALEAPPGTPAPSSG
jgi:uroporphyrinogen-III synthase